MPAILTPALALRHLRELSTDVRAAVALSPDGSLLAGDAAIEAPARALIELAGAATETTLATARGAVLLARAPSAALVVVAGPLALLELLRHDLATLLRDTQEPVDAAAAPDLAPTAPDLALQSRLETVAQALIDAADGISG